EWSLELLTKLGDSQRHSKDPAIAQAAQAASEVGAVRRTLLPFQNSKGGAAYGSQATYPTANQGDFPQRLAGLAAMIAARVPLRCVALTTDAAFDTHSGQAAAFNPGLQVVADSLLAF